MQLDAKILLIYYQILDVRDITIENVILTDSGRECEYEISNPANVNFGSKLTIKLGMLPEQRYSD